MIVGFSFGVNFKERVTVAKRKQIECRGVLGYRNCLVVSWLCQASMEIWRVHINFISKAKTGADSGDLEAF